jgi:hypothetical protein
MTINRKRYGKLHRLQLNFMNRIASQEEVAETTKYCFNERHFLQCTNGTELGGNDRLSLIKSSI